MGLLKEYSEIDQYGSPPTNQCFPMKPVRGGSIPGYYYDPGFAGMQCSFNEQLEIVSKLVTHINELKDLNPDADVSNNFYSYRNFVPNLINHTIALISTLKKQTRDDHVSRLLDTFKNHTHEYKFIKELRFN